MWRKCNVDCTWSSELAYVIGLFTSDGNLSSDGRHLNLTSKDEEMTETARRLLKLDNKIGRKARGGEVDKKYYVLQFGDINFYAFLLDLGLSPAKSKTLGPLGIPDQYFRDFLRGCIDGDGSIRFFNHPESRHKQIRVSICSASPRFLAWVRDTLWRVLGIEGGSFYHQKAKSISSLSFGKADSLKIMKEMYYAEGIPALSRKRKIATQLMGE